MFTRTVFYLTIVGLFLLAISRAALDDDAETTNREGLVLTATKWKDEKRALPGSMLYAADLLNNTHKAQVVEAVQMPGGYAGSGKFFNCRLEGWSARQHKWVSLWPVEPEPRPNIVSVEIKPGDHMEVCRNMLPVQAGADGQCVRYKFNTLWKQSPSILVVSNPILIGDRAAKERTPCRSPE